MRVEFIPNSIGEILKCAVIREPGDPKIYKESTLYYHIKRKLQEMGHDVIYKNPQKDMHLTDMPYYIRSRKRKKGTRSFWLVDPAAYIRLAQEDYNDGELVMLVGWDIFKGEGTSDSPRVF